MNINTYLEADGPIKCFDVYFWLFLILFTHFRPSRTRIFRKSRVVWSIVRKFKMVFVYQCLRLVKSKWTFMTSSLKIILICNWLKKIIFIFHCIKLKSGGKSIYEGQSLQYLKIIFWYFGNSIFGQDLNILERKCDQDMTPTFP